MSVSHQNTVHAYLRKGTRTEFVLAKLRPSLENTRKASSNSATYCTNCTRTCTSLVGSEHSKYLYRPGPRVAPPAQFHFLPACANSPPDFRNASGTYDDASKLYCGMCTPAARASLVPWNTSEDSSLPSANW